MNDKPPNPPAPKPATPMVDINGLWVKYGNVIAVRGITFQIPRGEVFGFIGPNGAGKSSTIRILATLQLPTAGRVRVGGIEVRQNPMAIRRKMGYMPDSFGLYDGLTVREYLHFFAAAYDTAQDQRDRLVDDVLALTDLRYKIDASVDGLSRGMKQRLGLARVLLHDPELLLLDEPASGLDPRARIEVREILKELSRMGKTILISSHILHELSQLCTRIGILEAGRLVTEGSLEEIYHRLGLMQLVHVQVVSGSEEVAAHVRRRRSGRRAGRSPLDSRASRVAAARGSARSHPRVRRADPHVPAGSDGAGDGVHEVDRGRDGLGTR
jgi:ABC-2 type transport system ATP-binding protein